MGFPLSELESIHMSELTQTAHRPPSLNRLPVELLSAIFLISQAFELSENEENEEEVSLPFEFRISHVSQRFRHVALSTGQMWCSILIEPGHSPSLQAARLVRSKECPLDVRLRNCDETSDVINKIVDGVFKHSPRWRTCVIEGGINSSIVSRIAHLATPQLKWIQITVHPPKRARTINEVWLGRSVLEGGCPLLKGVSLQNFAVHFARPPLSSVIHLQLDFSGHLPLGYMEFRELLMGCHLLKFLSIRGEIISVDPWPHTGHLPVALPCLLDLRISSLFGQVYSGILLTLDAPILQSLDLEGAQESDLDQFLRTPQHFPCLQSFSLHGSYLTPSKLNKVYAFYPSLDEMTMFGFNFNPSEILRVVSESICELGVGQLRSMYPTMSQRLSTLGVMLDSSQRASLHEGLKERLEDDESILELHDGGGWSYPRFFNWLQNFVTVEILLLEREFSGHEN
ncbi:hypothetical protein BT96DRAFT_911843 [Gymnopus androsaceus JB14]|uniref:F-box domain-containing protein n=1 Tax=Gymnopus androsaceus JB14 TaxID=1447944 RepID=A0A6A4IR51_9AGAR|nr:hypothetical protein BT96DRAFT_911843 [Gymnopus androsaceus JB14]